MTICHETKGDIDPLSVEKVPAILKVYSGVYVSEAFFIGSFVLLFASPASSVSFVSPPAPLPAL
jgi:hypothetical protein